MRRSHQPLITCFFQLFGSREAEQGLVHNLLAPLDQLKGELPYR